jgi:hypothetical protein
MSIAIDTQELLLVLERALREARDTSKPANPIWTDRIQWLSEVVNSGPNRGKSFVAAIGAALLAKSTYPDVDSLTQNDKSGAGARAYNLRKVATEMQKRLRNTVHLGTLSADPVNGAPFLRAPSRIEHFTVASYNQATFNEFVSWLRELDAYSAEKAQTALVSFLRVRMEWQVAEDLRAANSPRMSGAGSVAQLLDVVQKWMTDDPEVGSRGQAVVAAMLGLLWDDVEVVPKNHPAPFDVHRRSKPSKLAAEVKQRAIEEADVRELIRRAGEQDVPVALYAALAPGQKPLPIERLRSDALRDSGVFLEIVYDARDLAAKVASYGGLDVLGVATRLPQALIERCGPAGVSNGGSDELVSLLRGIEGP